MQNDGEAALLVVTVMARVMLAALGAKKRRRAKRMAARMFKALGKRPVNIGPRAVEHLRAEQRATEWWDEAAR